MSTRLLDQPDELREAEGNFSSPAIQNQGLGRAMRSRSVLGLLPWLENGHFHVHMTFTHVHICV